MKKTNNKAENTQNAKNVKNAKSGKTCGRSSNSKDCG